MNQPTSNITDGNDVLGFTLVELILAMGLFITVMLLATIGFIGINRTFARGIIRKQLSESVQLTGEEITRALRTSPVNAVGSSASTCKASTPSNPCISGPDKYNALTFTNQCFFWNTVDQTSVLKRNFESCPNTTENEGTVLAESRFKTEFLEVEKLGSTEKLQYLYRVRGIIRTIKTEAFNGTTGTDDEKFTGLICKGTQENEYVSTCAVERFEFIVNTRGASES